MIPLPSELESETKKDWSRNGKYAYVGGFEEIERMSLDEGMVFLSLFIVG